MTYIYYLTELISSSERFLRILFSYEPLHMHGVQVLDEDSATTRSALAFLKDLLLCRLRHWQRRVAYLGNLGKYRSQNTFLRERCVRHRQQWGLCRNASFVSEVCQSANLHVAKVRNRTFSLL